ncbi:MAG TPA: hypothetical protein PKI19_12065 [Elusimicrobiales bacterium]|nr:hypothetical protein [Elusimicrobiales bacterium]
MLKTAGFILLSLGLVAAFSAPPGLNAQARAGLWAAGAGAALLALARLFAGAETDRKNAPKFAAAIGYALLGIASLFAALFGLLEGRLVLAAAGAAAGLFALVSIFRAGRSQVTQLSLDIGRELNFGTIKEDSDYDVHGAFNGVQMAFSVIDSSVSTIPGRRWPRKPVFDLTVACAAENRRGLRLYAVKGGPLDGEAACLALSRAEAPPPWTDCTVRCEPSGADLSGLWRLRGANAPAAFTAAGGFHSLTLDGTLLEVRFIRDGVADKDQVAGLLDAVSKAAPHFP